MANSRRRFLSQAAVGAAAACTGDLRAARAAFGATLPGPVGADDDREWRRLASEYTLAPGVRYFNHASIGTMPKAVQQARVRYLELCETNPWLYMWGGAWEEAREATRAGAAAILGCDSAELAITHNTTEGFSLLAAGLDFERGDEVVFSNLNHAGASISFELQAEQRGYRVRRFELPLEAVREFTVDEVVERHMNALSDDTRLLVLPHIDNTVGLRHPVAAIAKAAKARGVMVAVDGAQAIGMSAVDVSALGVDVYVTSPHKWLQAPKGLGLLYVRKEMQERIRPQWVTWGQKRWGDSARKFEDYGTRNLPEVLTLGDACEFWQRVSPAARADKIQRLWQRLFDAVEAEPELQWRSPRRPELCASLVAIQRKGRGAAGWARDLWEKQHIVARGFDNGDWQTLRVSPNVMHSEGDVEQLVASLRA